jgi:hypothetical protein
MVAEQSRSMARRFNYVVCQQWRTKDKKTIINNNDVKCGTLDDLASEIEKLSGRIIYDKLKLPILFTTSRKTSTSENIYKLFTKKHEKKISPKINKETSFPTVS